MKISLIYFDFPFWRAEVVRISLFMGGIDFEDIRISSEEFQRVKKNGNLDNGTIIPFHQLPCLVVDDISLAQTGAIARFCGKLTKLYPVNNDLAAAKIDQFIDIATDITMIIISTKPENIYRLVPGELSRKLSILNKSIDPSHKYLVNNSISVADIAIWSLMCWLTSGKGKVDGISENIIKDYENIKKICLLVDKHPKVIEWINKTFPADYKRNIS